MNSITGYLLGIVGVCLIASIAKRLLGTSKSYKGLGNTIIGIFIVFNILSPILSANWDADNILAAGFNDGFQIVSQDALSYRQQAMRQSITSRVEAYIWNKVQELSLEVEVEITLSESYPYAPTGICIWGNVSPYAKTQLSKFLKEDLGIPKEAQTWMSARS